MTGHRIETPLARARGLGSAKEGASHFIKQRVTAVALIVLVPWLLLSAVLAAKGGYYGAVAWMREPWNALGLILLAATSFLHMRIGMQVVIEDYIGKSGTRQALLILNTFFSIVLFGAVALAVVKVWIGG